MSDSDYQDEPTRSLAQPRDASDDDPLVKAVEQYLQAGDSVSREEFIRGFPDIAGELRECLEALDFVEGAASGVKPEALKDPADEGGQLAPLQAIGDFRIVREIGRGGMGIVYEAEQLSLGRRVALKVLPFAAMLDPKCLSRFRHEAQAAGSLKHPNIVSIHAVGNERGVHYYAMELVEGKSLAQIIAARQTTGTKSETAEVSKADTSPIAELSTKSSLIGQQYFHRIAELGIQAADGLEHAHERGIIHRDIKPSNLMLDHHGNLWIADFGLAQIENNGTQLTLTGDILGTLRYMSPEQASGDHRNVDHRTDVYALGATLYELLAGRPVFRSEDRAKLLRDITDREPVRLRQIDSSIPVDLETIILKAMNKDPAGRYASCGELAVDLQRYLAHQPILARRPTLVAQGARWVRRNRLVAALSLSLILMFAATVYALARRNQSVAQSGPSGSEVRVRLVRRGDSEVYGNISPDGSSLAYPNWLSGNIARFDLRDTRRADLTAEGSWERPEQYGEQPIWSHDGGRLAFSWYRSGAKNRAELRVMSSEGGGSKTVYATDQWSVIWPCSWSGDGRHILIRLWDRKEKAALALVDTTRKRARIFDSFAPPLPHVPRLSPDGRYIAFTRQPSVRTFQHDVYLLDTKTGNSQLLESHPANDGQLCWTPDGRWITFISDRGGNNNLWAIRIRDGGKVGDPRLIHARIGNVETRGFDKLGSYYYVGKPSLSNIYTASVDFDNLSVISPPEAIASSFEGRNLSADWSPDGEYMAYLSRLGDGAGQTRITIRHWSDGQETVWQPNAPLYSLTRTAEMRWQRDGHSLILPGRTSSDTTAWLSFDSRSGRIKQLTTKQRAMCLGFTCSTIDGNVYVFAGNRLARVDMDSDAAEQLYRRSKDEPALTCIAVSPNGKELAVATKNEIRIFSADGKPLRTLYQHPLDGPGEPIIRALAWRPNGKGLVFGLRIEKKDGESVSLWHVPIAGTEARAIGITMPQLKGLRIHPDGRQILFVSRKDGPSSELWAIDNLLGHLNSGG